MKNSAQFSLFGMTLTAFTLCLAIPAQAQYMDFRSDKPGVELDLDVLNDLPRTPEKKSQKAAPAPAPRYAAPASMPPDMIEAPPAAPVPVVEPAPRKMHKPLFAAPIPTPMPQQIKPAPTPHPVATPAARKPYNPYLTSPVTAPQPRPAYAPMPVMPPQRDILDNLPAAARFDETTLEPPPRPHRKPDTPVGANTQMEPARAMMPETVLSYPPAASPKAPVQHYARPVLPATALRALPDEVISETEINQTAVTLPAQKPVTQENVAEHRTDAAPIETETQRPLRKPLNSLAQQKPDEKETLAATTSSLTEQESAALPVAPPPARVVTRPALVTTDAPPPARPVLKKAEVTMPLSENDFKKIAVNMERVPVQVAIAPPKPLHSAGTAPLAADMTLEFDRTSENLNDTAQAKLRNIVSYMSVDENKRLQIRAYASGEDGSTSSARSKSLTRATEIRSFLMDNGIKPTRVIVRAMGQETDRKPLDRVDLIFMP